MRFRTAALFVAIAFLAGVQAVSADEVMLKNGDRLTGKVLKKENGTLELETSYAGVIKIEWKKIETVTLDEPLRVLLKSEEVVQASSITRDNDRVRLRLDPDMEPDLEVREMADEELAYVNPDPWRLGEAWKFSGRVNFGFEYERGNTDTDEFDFDGDIKAERGKNRLHAWGSLERDVNNNNEKDRTTKKEWYSFGKVDHFVTDKRFWTWGAFAEADDNADLTLRAGTGPGLGYQFFHSKKTNLSVEAGPARVWERYQASTNDEEYWALRWGIDFDRQLFGSIVQAFHKQFGLYGLTDNDKAYIKSRTGLRFPIVAGFTATAQAELDWDNDPARDRDKLDTTLTFLLGYEW